MAMHPHHLIIGEDFYIDPLDGSNKVIKCTLINQHPHTSRIYLLQSKKEGFIYFVDIMNIYKKKDYAMRLQQIRTIKNAGKYSPVNNFSDLAEQIKRISYQAGESGRTIRRVLDNNKNLIKNKGGLDNE